MGRKIDMKKIQDVTKCQVTFSKRRSSLMKKANEISVCCDVDVAFLALSPSGRVSKYCNQKRIEVVLHRYVNLPADERLTHMDNVQGKLEKLRNLSHIKSDNSKLQFLDKQIENLELQIRKSGLELQLLEADLRDYEVSPDQEPSLHQLSWCERNLNHSLEKVNARKNALANLSASNKQPMFQKFDQMDQMELANQGGNPFFSNLNGKERGPTIQNPSTSFMMKLDNHWISPYFTRVGHAMDPGPSNVRNYLFPDSPVGIPESGIKPTLPDSKIPFPQSSAVDNQGAVEKFLENNNVNGWDNFPPVPLSDVALMPTPGLSNFQSPRFMSTIKSTTNGSSVEMGQSLYDDMEKCFQLTNNNSNLNQLNNMEGQGTISPINLSNHDNTMMTNGNAGMNIDTTNNGNEMQQSDQVQGIYNEGLPQENIFEFQPIEDTLEENMASTSRIQNSGLWEWEDLLIEEDFNFNDFFQ